MSTAMYSCQQPGLPPYWGCYHEACRPVQEEKRVDPLPHYTATLTVQRDDAEGEVIVRGVVTGTAAAVVQTLHALADAFETEAQR